MHDNPLPKSRLLMLRAAYAIIGFSLAVTLWPQLVEPVQDWPLKSGGVAAMLVALSLLALVVPVALLVPWDLVWRRFVRPAQPNAAAVTS